VERVPAPRRRATGRLRAIRRARGLLRNVQALTPTNAAVEQLADLHRRAEELSERRFGIELAAAVAAAGDPGTVYHLPLSAREKPMALPLVIREVYDPEHGTRFLVAGGAEHLPAGAEVLRWNGVPLARAVELRAARIGAPTPEARRARALASLTHRPAALLARFDEGPVRLDWRDPEGAYETVFEWRPAPEPPAGDISEPWWSLDPLVEALAWARGPVTPVRVDDGHEGPLHLRVHSFRVTPQDLRGVTVDLPAAAADRRPLILDVRGNAGGSLRTADGLLAALGSEAPPPAVQVRATRTAEDLVRAPAPEWLAEIRAARKRGESHTAPLTMARSGPALPPVAGTVVLVVDALTSGAAAYLAARFARERRGPVLSTAGDPGLGGGLTTTVGEDDPSYPGHFSVTFARFAGHEDAPVPIEVRRPRTLDDAEVRDAAAELLKGWR
jgi:hypothetical protein